MADNVNFIPANELPNTDGSAINLLCVEDGEMKQINPNTIPVTEAESVEVLCLENGALKRKAGKFANEVFIIDSTADDYDLTSTDYGNTVKEALLRGDRVFYYDGTYYWLVIAFGVYESTTGDVILNVYASGYASTTGAVVTGKCYPFAITL